MHIHALLILCVVILSAVPARSQAKRSEYELEITKRFPHYVTISKDGYSYYNSCSGSIIGDKWILTALNCVRMGRFTVHFMMENFYDNKRSFSLSLDQSAVIPYPTDFENIAVVKLPISLQYSELLKPISYQVWDEEYDRINNGFAVMPGFNRPMSSTLTYGMFRVLCRRECKNNFKNLFDEFTEICAMDWNKNNQPITPDGNEGSGLIQGWPRNPRLIGIYNGQTSYHGVTGLSFVKVAKYRQWIDEVLKGHSGHKPSCCLETATNTTTRWPPTTTSTTTTPPWTTTTTTTTTTTPKPPTTLMGLFKVPSPVVRVF